MRIWKILLLLIAKLLILFCALCIFGMAIVFCEGMNIPWWGAAIITALMFLAAKDQYMDFSVRLLKQSFFSKDYRHPKQPLTRRVDPTCYLWSVDHSQSVSFLVDRQKL